MVFFLYLFLIYCLFSFSGRKEPEILSRSLRLFLGSKLMPAKSCFLLPGFSLRREPSVKNFFLPLPSPARYFLFHRQERGGKREKKRKIPSPANDGFRGLGFFNILTHPLVLTHPLPPLERGKGTPVTISLSFLVSGSISFPSREGAGGVSPLRRKRFLPRRHFPIPLFLPLFPLGIIPAEAFLPPPVVFPTTKKAYLQSGKPFSYVDALVSHTKAHRTIARRNDGDDDATLFYSFVIEFRRKVIIIIVFATISIKILSQNLFFSVDSKRSAGLGTA